MLLFVCIFVVALANAHRVEKERSEEQIADGSTSAVQESVDAARRLVAMPHPDQYIWIARVMLLVAAVTLVLWRFTDLISLFVVEASVFLLFMAFWSVQTFELESRQVVILRPVTTADRPADG